MKKLLLCSMLMPLLMQAMDKQKDPVCLLLAPYGPLLVASIQDSCLNRIIPTSCSPLKLQNDLIAWIQKNDDQMYQAHQGCSLPALMQQWLLDEKTGKEMTKIVQDKNPWYKNPIMYNVAGTAFDPKKAASHLKILPKMVQLISLCKNKGYEAAITTNYNSESFADVEKQHPVIVTTFEHRITSGKPGNPGNSTKLNCLTMEATFFRKTKEMLEKQKGHTYTYIYIDSADGTEESLKAAQEAGLQTIAIPEGSEEQKVSFLKANLIACGLDIE